MAARTLQSTKATRSRLENSLAVPAKEFIMTMVTTGTWFLATCAINICAGSGGWNDTENVIEGSWSRFIDVRRTHLSVCIDSRHVTNLVTHG